jgi:nucleotide-binding universal stress UspA family protein
MDGTNTGPLGLAARLLSGGEPPVIGLLTVVDSRPRMNIDRTRERFWRPPLHRQPVVQAMLAAEQERAQELLRAGLEAFPGAEPMLRQGLPELEIVNAAAEWQADVVLVCPRARYGEPPRMGPRSVGHVARFVLDHAPCPVLLVRQPAGDLFPLNP